MFLRWCNILKTTWVRWGLFKGRENWTVLSVFLSNVSFGSYQRLYFPVLKILQKVENIWKSEEFAPWNEVQCNRRLNMDKRVRSSKIFGTTFSFFKRLNQCHIDNMSHILWLILYEAYHGKRYIIWAIWYGLKDTIWDLSLALDD